MNLSEIGDLLERIAMHYPRFSSQISDVNGNMRKSVAEEWHRLMGFLSFQDALDRLDTYMMNSETTKPPMAVDFLKFKPAQKSDTWSSPEEHTWHLEFHKNDPQRMHGRLYDQEDREYVHDPCYMDGYHYNAEGRICTIDGRVVH